jgi:methylated-DNA-[protein]-cysteine S-methyltransferase
MPTSIGRLRLAADTHGLREVWFEDDKYRTTLPTYWLRDNTKVDFARQQLEQYFDGTRQAFDLPLHPLGTPFQLAVWSALAQIPYGATVSYADIARRIGHPQAVRAVGAANGRNPIPIIVPCHRVIGSNGSLTGFGGGLPTKRFLLAMEDRVARGDLFGRTA